MIDLQVLEAVAPFVEHNSNRNFTAIPGSTLSTLTQQLIDKCKFVVSARDNNVLNDEFSITDVVGVVNEASKDECAHVAAHGVITNEAVKNITRIMRNNILLARTVVLPIVDKYTVRLGNVVSEKSTRGALALNILEDKKRTILSSPQLKALVSEDGQRTSYSNIALPRYHKSNLTIPELVALIRTGNGEFDKTISQWIDVNQLEPQLKSIYTDVYLHGNISYDNFTKYINVNEYHRTLLTILLCWGLTGNVQENMDIALNDYRKTMEIFSAACCGMLHQAINAFERNVKYKNLVLQYPAADREFSYDTMQHNVIIVDPHTYAEYLEMGGTPEAIFGAYLTDRAVDINNIINNSALYIKEYNRQVARGKLTSMNNTLTIVKDELNLIIFDIVKDVLEQGQDEEEALTEKITIDFTGNKHIQDAREVIKRISAHDISNYYLLMLNLVCDCFFAGTNVGALIRKIDALDPEGEKDVNEMAIIATTDIIVDWFLSQIETDNTAVSLEGYYIK